MGDETTKIEFHSQSRLPIRNRHRKGQLGKGAGDKRNGVGNTCVRGRGCESRRGKTSQKCSTVKVHFPSFISKDSNFVSFIPLNLFRCLTI